MTARSTLLKTDVSHRVKRTNYKSTNNDVARDILRGLGKSPDRDPNYLPPVPLVGPRLPSVDDVMGRRTNSERQNTTVPAQTNTLQLDDATIERIAEAVYGLFEGNLARLVDLNTEIAGDTIKCPICSHGNCHHFHQRGEMTGAEVEDYLGCERSTRNTWLHRKEMPPPISTTTPYRWDPHVISCFKLDKKLVLANGQYDRAEHLRLLPIAAAEHERKRAARSEKLSAHMRRDNARRKRTSKHTTKRGAK